MASRAERDKKKQNEQFQRILTDLLREQCNKTCADCDAKAPRWASWNLGVFLCIRCAGIHRNLGVHISRVKSVNLDSWSSEQVANMVEWGNRRANKYYEAKLIDSFVRPSSDQAVENFIRSKYISKHYIGDAMPEINKAKVEKSATKTKHTTKEGNAVEKVQRKSRQSSSSSASPAPDSNSPIKQAAAVLPQQPAKPQQQAVVNDLISLSVSNNQVNIPTQQPVMNQQQPSLQQNSVSQGTQNLISEEALFGAEEKKDNLDKDSILSLYGTPAQRPTYGVPGGIMMNQSQISNMNMMQPSSPGMRPMQYNRMQQPMSPPGVVNTAQLNQVTQGMNQMSLMSGMGPRNQMVYNGNPRSSVFMSQGIPSHNQYGMMRPSQPMQQQQQQGYNMTGQYQQAGQFPPRMQQQQVQLMQGNQQPAMYNQQQFRSPNPSGKYPGNQQMAHGQTLNNQLWN